MQNKQKNETIFEFPDGKQRAVKLTRSIRREPLAKSWDALSSCDVVVLSSMTI